MKLWLNANWKTLARVAAVVTLYVMAHYFPGAEEERRLVIQITEILGLGVLGFTPGIRRAKRKDDK